MARYPRAAWRPLPENATEGANHPRLFISHTMVGWNHGTEQWFRRSDVKSESHFGIADVATREDPVRQWIDTDREADTNWDANGISVTVELEDRGDPTRPLSQFQIEELVRLGVWAHHVHGIPLKFADGPAGSGYGWHQQYREWNKSSHNCPGPTRVQQLRDVVYPEVFRRAKPRRYQMVIYTRRGTPDTLSALAAHAAAPKGVVTSDLGEAKAALDRGEAVIAVGGPAADDLPGARHVVGGNAVETGRKVFDLAKSGWV